MLSATVYTHAGRWILPELTQKSNNISRPTVPMWGQTGVCHKLASAEPMGKVFPCYVAFYLYKIKIHMYTLNYTLKHTDYESKYIVLLKPDETKPRKIKMLTTTIWKLAIETSDWLW